MQEILKGRECLLRVNIADVGAVQNASKIDTHIISPSGAVSCVPNAYDELERAVLVQIDGAMLNELGAYSADMRLVFDGSVIVVPAFAFAEVVEGVEPCYGVSEVYVSIEGGEVVPSGNITTIEFVNREEFNKEVESLRNDIINISADMLVPATYAELKALRDAGELIPGMMYRITDFVTITTQANTQSAGHQFDIVVTALDERTLSEEAMAMMHEGDTYFAKSDIAAWRVWYSLDADSKYSWVTGANHKGVIYRLVDEYNNDLPYDFKNIQFYYDNTWYYTFDSGSLDASVITSVVIGNRIARNDFLLRPLVFANVSRDNTIVGNGIRGIWSSFVCYGKTNDNVIIFTSACNVVGKAEFCGNQLNIDKDLIANDSFTKNRAVYLYTALTANAKVFACQFDVQQRNSVPLVLTAGRLQDCQFFGTGTFTIANASGATTGTMSFSTINLGMNGSNVKFLWNTTASLNSRIEGVTLKAYNWGTSEVVVDITSHPVNATYPLTIAKNKAGEVKVFCEADLA